MQLRRERRHLLNGPRFVSPKSSRQRARPLCASLCWGCSPRQPLGWLGGPGPANVGWTLPDLGHSGCVKPLPVRTLTGRQMAADTSGPRRSGAAITQTRGHRPQRLALGSGRVRRSPPRRPGSPAPWVVAEDRVRPVVTGTAPAPVAGARSRVGRRWREAGSARSWGRWVVPDFRFGTGALRSAGFFRTAVPPATGTRQSSRGGRTSRPIVDVFTFPNAGAGLASMKPLVEPMASIAAGWAAEGDDPSFGGIRPFAVTIPCPSGTNRSQLSCSAERLAPSAGPWVLPRGTVAAHPVPRLTGLRLERLHQLGRDSPPGPFQVRRLVSGGNLLAS